MKKTVLIIAAVTTIVIVYTPMFTLLWAIASFMLYLFKDVPFSWWSVAAYIISKFIKAYFFLLAKKRTLPRKSGLTERIEELKRRDRIGF